MSHKNFVRAVVLFKEGPSVCGGETGEEGVQTETEVRRGTKGDAEASCSEI